MTALPTPLTQGLTVRAVTPVSGGDIASAYRLDTDDGPVFAKTAAGATPDLFAREAAGLAVLRAHAPAGLGVPRVVRAAPEGLLLQWIDVGRPRAHTDADLGRALAGLHRVTHATFGALDDSLAGWIGSAPVDMTPTTSWAEFWVERRLRPLTTRAVERGRLDPQAVRLVEAVAARPDAWCGPPEPPALVHGDLWAGNRLVDVDGGNWLIDPAAHWGHREADLAMMRLFGGFGEECFAAYAEVYPPADGWLERVDAHQLTPLLVHALLFGGGYGEAVMRILRRAG